MLAARAGGVCVGGGLQATWGTQTSLPLQPVPAGRGSWATDPVAKHKWQLPKKYPPGGGIP